MLDAVLPSCRAAAAASRLVAIDRDRLGAFAAEIAPLLPREMRHTPQHLAGTAEEVVAYFLVLDSLNFGSAFLPRLRSYRGESGYFAIAASLRDWFLAEGVPDPAALRAVDAAAAGRILAQDHEDEALQPLILWCARALRELGAFIDAELDGQPINLVRRADGRAAAMVALLLRMPMFRDVSRLMDRDVHLLKRAQILVHDIAIAADGEQWFALEGLETLTIFADNMIPAVLEAHGLLRYRPALAARIRDGGVLRQGSRAEVELRANAIVACEWLRETLERAGIATTAREVDFALWNLGEGGPSSRYRTHRTPTWFY